MTSRRVGIVSENNSLFVALSLRGEGLEFARAADVSSLGAHDVAVLDVPEGHDAKALAADVPGGPVVVVLTDDDTPVDGATVVPRPYAVGDLLELLRTVTPADTAPPPATTEVLFTAAVSPRRGTSSAPTVAESAVATIERTATAEPDGVTVVEDIPDILDLESDDPIVHVRQLAQALSEALGRAEFLTSIGMLADRLAASLAREHDADHVALWHRAQDSYIILGAVGLTPAARRDVVAADHPAIEQAQSHGGFLVEDLSHRTAHTRSLPGARSPRYGCVVLDQPAIPVHLVTVSGQGIGHEGLVAMSDVIREATEAWGAVVEVERLRTALGMA